MYKFYFIQYRAWEFLLGVLIMFVGTTFKTRYIKNIGIFVKKFERVCLGVSNKRFSSKIFSQLKDKDMHIVSLAITAFATYKGVMFLRVHHVGVNTDALEVAWKTYKSA